MTARNVACSASQPSAGIVHETMKPRGPGDGQHLLDRHVPGEHLVPRQPHPAHAAVADHPQQPVPPGNHTLNPAVDRHDGLSERADTRMGPARRFPRPLAAIARV